MSVFRGLYREGCRLQRSILIFQRVGANQKIIYPKGTKFADCEKHVSLQEKGKLANSKTSEESSQRNEYG